jgi:hypothetical protein
MESLYVMVGSFENWTAMEHEYDFRVSQVIQIV